MSSQYPSFNPILAAQARPGLERTLRELEDCLDRFETLHESFSRDFLKLFDEPEAPAAPGGQAQPAVKNLYFFTLANFAGSSLAHLRHYLEEADLACGRLAPPYSK